MYIINIIIPSNFNRLTRVYFTHFTKSFAPLPKFHNLLVALFDLEKEKNSFWNDLRNDYCSVSNLNIFLSTIEELNRVHFYGLFVSITIIID